MPIRKKERDKSHYVRTIDDFKDLSCKGKYVELALENIYVNLPIKSNRTGTVQSFTIVGLLFNNLWDYRIGVNPSNLTLIDTEGFQHKGDGCHYYEYDNVAMPDNKSMSVKFAWPNLTLEDHTKSRGYIWFDALTACLPHRLVFLFQIFKPGDTSGWEQDRETIEFVIPDLQNSHPLLAYYNPNKID